MTFRKLEERSRAFAGLFTTRAGTQKGDRVALMMPNLLQYPVALFGILRAGMIVVNVNLAFTRRANLSISLTIAARRQSLLFLTCPYAGKSGRAKRRYSTLPDADGRPAFTSQVRLLTLSKYTRQSGAKIPLARCDPFRSAPQHGYRMQYVKPEVVAEDSYFPQYTGGTTGVAKGAMLTHRNMLANLEQVSDLWAAAAPGERAGSDRAAAVSHFCLNHELSAFIELRAKPR